MLAEILVYLLHLPLIQPELGGVNQIADLVRSARSDDGAGHAWMAQRPGNGNLTRRHLVREANIRQELHQFQVARQSR